MEIKDEKIADEIMRLFIDTLRKQYRMIEGKGLPIELTDTQVMAAVLVKLMEDYYL